MNFICLDHIRVEYANAIAGLGTYGFPSIGSFLGFMESINRDLKSNSVNYALKSVLILSHQVNLQTYTIKYGRLGFTQKRRGIEKDGKDKAIIEEGYLHADLSLIFEVEGDAINNFDEQNILCTKILRFAKQKRLAGGYAVFENCSYLSYEKMLMKLVSLYPFSALVNASDYFAEFMKKFNFHTKIDAFIALNSQTYRFDQDTEQWSNIYKKHGYIVPILVGYKEISETFTSSSDIALRNPDYEAAFVESVFSFGEWVCSVYKLKQIIQDSFIQAFWQYASKGHFHLFNSYYFDQKNNEAKELFIDF